MRERRSAATLGLLLFAISSVFVMARNSSPPTSEAWVMVSPNAWVNGTLPGPPLFHWFGGTALGWGRKAVGAPAAQCPAGPPETTDGLRRLALIVGVSKYPNPDFELPGAANDARRFLELLTGPNGYGFPRVNVCLLLDQEATVSGFKHAFDSALVDRARPGDLAVLYYAGHGSNVRDVNGDEPDELDETLILHDSRLPLQHDLTDDELNSMLARLYSKTQNVVAIFDSCNSGTVSRNGMAKIRYQPPAAPTQRTLKAEEDASGDGAQGYGSTSMPGLVTASAAADGTNSHEVNGAGVFTSALIRILSEVSKAPLLWSQVAVRLPPLTAAAQVYQISYFQGELSKEVFGVKNRVQPVGWRITSGNDPHYKLQGPPLPGWSPGAELRVYDGAAPVTDILEPSKALALLKITRISGLTAEALRLDAPRPQSPKILPGSLAVLSGSGNETRMLKVRLRPPTQPGGLSKDLAKAIRDALLTSPEVASSIAIVNEGATFELQSRNDGLVQLVGPEGNIRNTYPGSQASVLDQIRQSLLQHSRQQALLQLEGEGGLDYVNNQSLQVELIPAPTRSACARGDWIPSQANQEQLLPLCQHAQLKVTLSETVFKPLMVGGLVLSSDGAILGFPAAGELIKLYPGQSYVFGGKDTMRGLLPLDVRDYIMVFGTPEEQPILWREFSSAAMENEALRARAARSPLDRFVSRYLTRGIGSAPVMDTAPWTSTVIPVRTILNARFLNQQGDSTPAALLREYTIPRFDLRPYLPDDPQGALFKGLQQEYLLANKRGDEGIPYGQHDWSLPSDEQNLEKGIDCSRAIWFAFTRAGLPYNKGNRFVTTAGMVGEESPMSEAFESCQDAPTLKLGDVLVYRDSTRGIGHVVMVIDPEKRIAWGSHGWDGHTLEPQKGTDVQVDRGVDYQRIKYKKDWERWDMQTMKKVACWRYRQFEEEGKAPGGRPGVAALEGACHPQGCGGE